MTNQQNPKTDKRPLKQDSIAKSLLTLALPVILANILQAGYQLTDAFWVGRLGGNAVAAVSFTFPVVFLIIAMGAGLAIAGSTLIAQYFGAKNQRMVDHVTAQTLLMVVIVAVVLGGIGYLLAPGLLRLMGVAPEVFPDALNFMRITFGSLVFNFFFFMFQSVMRGVGEVKLPVYIVLGTVILNFILDPMFIYGWQFIPAFGVSGAALATLLTQTVAAAIGLAVLLRGKYGIHLSLHDFKPDFAYIKRAFLLGFPASIEQSARALGLTVMTFLIASFGTLAVASYGVGSNILQVIMIPAMGLSMAIAVLVGQNIGAGNTERAAQIGRFGSWLGFWALTALGAIAFLFAPQLVRFFVPGDQAVIDSGANFIRIIALSWGLIGAQMSLTGVLRAAGDMKAPMIFALVSQWVFQFPLAYILSKHTTLGIDGIWWSLPITNVLTTILTLIWYAQGKWKEIKLTQEDSLTETVTEEVLIEEGTR